MDYNKNDQCDMMLFYKVYSFTIYMFIIWLPVIRLKYRRILSDKYNSTDWKFRITLVPCVTENVSTLCRKTSRVYFSFDLKRGLWRQFYVAFDLKRGLWRHLLDVTSGTSFSRQFKFIMQFICSLYADMHTQCAIWLSESADI